MKPNRSLSFLLIALLLTFFLLFTAACFDPEGGVSGGFRFEKDKSGEGYVLKGCTEDFKGGDVTLPSTYKDKPVTAIGAGAFGNLSGERALTSVTIPDSVKSIGEDAFSYGSQLTSVTVGNGVTVIGKYAFDGCTKLTSVILGNQVQTLEEGAFCGCTALRTLTLPDSVTAIGPRAFCACSNLYGIRLSKSLESIGEEAFFYCPSLLSITIPESVTSIHKNAFDNDANYTKLSEIYNLSSVVIDESYQLRAWDIYTDAHTPSKLETTPEGFVFYRDAEKCYLMGYVGNDTDIVLPTDYRGRSYEVLNANNSDLGGGAFHCLRGINSITVPVGIKDLSGSVFDDCDVRHLYLSATVEQLDVDFCELESITVDAGNPTYQTIDGLLYQNDENWGLTLLHYPMLKSDVTDYTLPSTVQNIRIIELPATLNSFTIPTSVIRIEELPRDNDTCAIYYAGTKEEWERIDGSGGVSVVVHCTDGETDN